MLSNMGLTDVRQEAGVGRAAMCKVRARFVQAEGSVHGVANLRGVFIFLAIVFPPADRAQCERVRRFQRLVPAAGAAKSGLHQCFHTGMDGKNGACVYAE
jgi:hypothetical protein